MPAKSYIYSQVVINWIFAQLEQITRNLIQTILQKRSSWKKCTNSGNMISRLLQQSLMGFSLQYRQQKCIYTSGYSIRAHPVPKVNNMRILISIKFETALAFKNPTDIEYNIHVFGKFSATVCTTAQKKLTLIGSHILGNYTLYTLRSVEVPSYSSCDPHQAIFSNDLNLR